MSPYGLFVLSNLGIASDSSSVMIFESLEGCVGCRIHASPMTVVRG